MTIAGLKPLIPIRMKKIVKSLIKVCSDAFDRADAAISPTPIKSSIINSYSIRKAGENMERALNEVEECGSIGYRQLERFANTRRIIARKDVRELYIGDTVLHNSAFDFQGLKSSPCSLNSLTKGVEHAIYILNNNDIYRAGLDRYIKLFLSSPDSIFLIWDWDNHHALNWSLPLACFSDFYIPAHLDFYAQLAALGVVPPLPVFAGTNQWSRTFLNENERVIMKSKRSEQPLGRHILYRQFPARAAALSRLNKFFPEVGPSQMLYHRLPSVDRLEKWCSHAVHWVLPVRNDVPIRLFDALITGGIPIVPKSLAFHPALSTFIDHIVFYDVSDLDEPLPVTTAAIEKFKDGGVQGVEQRFRLAFNFGHVDGRLSEIMNRLVDAYALRL